jgi:hypothetical protein
MVLNDTESLKIWILYNWFSSKINNHIATTRIGNIIFDMTTVTGNELVNCESLNTPKG